jgi:D-serine deaminase-like pyridoxal phosphate-dependent protein
MEQVLNSSNNWYQVEDVSGIASPALLVFPRRIESNIEKMITMAGSPEKLRPHVKTHKMEEVVKLQMKHGISKFKTATISETEMVAECGAKDILLAIQPVGPNIDRFFRLKKAFMNTKISCIADSENIIRQLSDKAYKTGLETHIWLDINNGMHRTGIAPGEEAVKLIKKVISLPMLKAEGLQVYDGHIREKDPVVRKEISDRAFMPVMKLTEDLQRAGTGNLKIVAGGSPTFPIHALRPGVESSPGTLLLWDYGYSSSFKDMDFLHAAILLTRVISKPGKDLLCLDLGHKAVASEMPQPRVIFPGLKDYSIINHNEEHMVIRTAKAGNFNTGDHFYGIPWHICPTVDRYDYVTIIDDHKIAGQWNVSARKRMITM